MEFIKAIKSRKFWGGLLTAVGAFLTGAMTVPEVIINIINLIGG